MKKYLLLFLLICAGKALFAQTGSIKLLNSAGVEINNYASITEAYLAIPTPLTQAYTIELQSIYVGSSETVPLVLGPKAGSSPSHTITIRPAANFGSILLAAPVSLASLIELNDADYLILDGRPGGIGTTRAITLENTASNGNTIGLINGATHNIIRYINLQNSGLTSSSSTIALLTAASNAAGNSDNRFEFNVSSGSRNGFTSNGTITNRNRNNVFFGNDIQSTIFSGIWMQQGTGNVLIDSNTVNGTNTPETIFNFGILFDNQTDTAIIRNNHVYGVHTTNSAAMRGISIRSTLPTGANNMTHIYNNFISLHMPGNNSTSVVGLEYAGGNLINAKIWHNTISIGGTLSSGGLSGNVVSAAFSKTATHASSNFDLKNNLFLNSRTGGANGTQHLALSINNSGTNTLDYNTYNSAGFLARVNGNTFISLADYRLGLGAQNEVNGNVFQVQTISNTDLRLSGTALGNPALAGTVITAVTTDRFGTARSNVPYRGAQEASPTLGGTPCTGTPDRGDLTQSDTLFCPGNPAVLLVLTQPALGASIIYEWQESSDQTTFTTISGAQNDSLVVSPNSTRWYRVMTRCLATSTFAYSDTISIFSSVRPVVGALTFTVQGAVTYNFTLNNSVAVTEYIWDFGDGSTAVSSTIPNISHTYITSGSYPVRVKANNICGTDSIQLNLNVVVSVEENAFPYLSIFPNPVTERVYVRGISTNYSLTLRDLQGRLLANYNTDSDIDFSLAELKPGVYLLEIGDSSGKRSVHRLLKK